MSVQIIVPSIWKQLMDGVDEIKVDGKTVGECLSALIRKFPKIKEYIFDKDGTLLNNVDIFINGKNAYPEELLKSIADGDEIFIINIFSGG